MPETWTPVIVGIGQFTERLDDDNYRALSAVEIAAAASRAAFSDALSLSRLGPLVDTIATTRTFEDSVPQLAFPFGRSNNFPRSICRRLGIDPARAIWEVAGGDTPQKLVNEICEKIAGGEVGVALLTGAEAISTARHLQRIGREVDWSETVDAEVEDRAIGVGRMVAPEVLNHGLVSAPLLYGVCENARRRKLGMSRADYALEMGRLFAPFTRIASSNPFASMANRAYTAEELATPSDSNRMIADPYPRLLVSRDQVNQGAALILTSTRKARELGIDERKWIYLHGYAEAAEHGLLERPDLGVSPAAQTAARNALAAAGIDADAVDFFDLYSCFPIAVSNVADCLGITPDDPRGLTVTGGLPYFGGPGNNYSMHGIASTVERLRARPGSYGFVGANGGFLSKYAVGVYASRPAPFRPCDNTSAQASLDAAPVATCVDCAEGEGLVETYTIAYDKHGEPVQATIIGRLRRNGSRFIATTATDDARTPAAMAEQDPLGAPVVLRRDEKRNLFSFGESWLDAAARAPEN